MTYIKQTKVKAYEEFKDNMDVKYFHEWPYPHYRAPHAYWWDKKVRVVDILKVIGAILFCIIWVSYILAIRGAFG